MLVFVPILVVEEDSGMQKRSSRVDTGVGGGGSYLGISPPASFFFGGGGGGGRRGGNNPKLHRHENRCMCEHRNNVDPFL